MPRQYKVVETSTVSDEELETILNEWTAKGWTLESIQFAMRECLEAPEHGLRALHARRRERGLRPAARGSGQACFLRVAPQNTPSLVAEGFAWRLASFSGSRR